MKRFVIGILGAALLSGMAVWNIIHAEYISETYDNDRNYAYLTTGQVTYNKMKNEDYIKGTYLIDRDVSVTGNGVYKQIMTDIVTVDFDVEDMLGISGILAENDMGGCIISSGLAYHMFGSIYATGFTVTVQGVDHVVRSVTDSEDNFILIQAEQERGEDWELVEHREISGLVIDISEENYRGEYAAEVGEHHGYSSDCYYVTDYLNILPNINLPAKWSDFDFGAEASSEWKQMSERRLYADKDVLEIFYYRQRQQLNLYRWRSFIFGILLAGWCVMMRSFITSPSFPVLRGREAFLFPEQPAEI